MVTMKNPRKLFHLVSYLQYPLVVAAILFYIPFVIALTKNEIDWQNLNYVLILFGVALSFSTLQDTTKTQNKLSRKIWEHPKKGKVVLFVMAVIAVAFITFGLVSLYQSQTANTENVAVGLIVLGIGFLGILKSSIEMFENHRKDKNPESRAT